MEKLRKHIEEITKLTDEEFKQIKSFFTLKKVRKHQYLIQEGDKATHEYLVIGGMFRLFYLDEDGKEHVLEFATQDWWISDYDAFFNQKMAKMYVICMEGGEVLSLTLQGREKLSADFRKMEYFFRVKKTKSFVAQQKRIISLLSFTPQQRFEEFGKLHPESMQKIPKKYIAAYLGVSRETLSRLYSDSK